MPFRDVCPWSAGMGDPKRGTRRFFLERNFCRRAPCVSCCNGMMTRWHTPCPFREHRKGEPRWCSMPVWKSCRSFCSP